MAVNRNDFVYLLIAIVLAGIGAVVIGNPNVLIGLSVLAALLAVGLVMAIYFKPSLGSVVLIVAVFTNISRTFTDRGLPSIIKPLVAIVAVAILLRYINSAREIGGQIKIGGIISFLLFFFMVTAFSYFVADNKQRAVEAIIDLGKDIVIIFCIVFALRRPETWKQSTWTVILITTILSILGGYQVISGNYNQDFFGLAHVVADVGSSSTTYRIAGPINEPNIWAQIVVAVVPLVVYRLVYEQQIRKKLLMVGFLGILLFEILNSYSRGAYIALAIIFALVMLGRWRSPVVFLTGTATILLALAFLPAGYSERLQTLSLLSPTNQNGVYQEGSFRGRSSEMLTGLKMFAVNPFLGVGAANYPNNYQKYTQSLGLEVRAGEQDPHSLYVQILAETGILGAIAFVGFSTLLLINLFKARQSVEHLSTHQNWAPWISAIQLSIISYLITSFFLHGGYIRYFWIFVALGISAIQLTEGLLIESDRNHTLELPA